MNQISQFAVLAVSPLAWVMFGVSLAVGVLAPRLSPAPEGSVQHTQRLACPNGAVSSVVVPAPKIARSLPHSTQITPEVRAFGCLNARERAGIYLHSETVAFISHKRVEELLEHQSELMRSARLLPVLSMGNVIGIRIFGLSNRFTPGAVFTRLGFENGDVVQTVNGMDIVQPDRALEAYSRLRSVDDLAFGLLRNDRAMRLQIALCAD